MITQDFVSKIEEASSIIGKTWPLYGFVTSNPLSGYEHLSFQEALLEAKNHLGFSALPQTYMFRQAWHNGEIDQNILKDLLLLANYKEEPAFYLQKMDVEIVKPSKNKNQKLDRILSKWLGVFLDEGMAEWEMPNKQDGFFNAWRKLALYDKEIGLESTNQIPKTAKDALDSVLEKYKEQDHLDIFKFHLAALPGWTGYIKYRVAENTVWQQKYPISLEEYLAVRLFIAKQIDADIFSAKLEIDQNLKVENLKYIWLEAWEKSYQGKLSSDLAKNLKNIAIKTADEKLTTAQLVFCIDTRSELLRRHIEQKGNYETFGYAGFFGLAADYQDLKTGIVRKSCPPIVPSAYKISENAIKGQSASLQKLQQKNADAKFFSFLSQRLKNMLPSAFGYVEGTGLFYGISMVWRTLMSSKLSDKLVNSEGMENICETHIDYHNKPKSEQESIAIDEKVGIVKSAFDLLGWNKFAPLVVFAGHGSHSANNPFGSSLDCGACAASPGRHNARMLAKLANLPEVRVALKTKFNINIPAETHFIGAEHNTTTDEVTLFDAQSPASHKLHIELLKTDLLAVQHSAISERLGLENGLETAVTKSGNWAETRPEWGLAKNAGFIVAPRSLTKDMDLGNRCFLHSYNWELDEGGKFLEGIMQGPMVVTQWINNHYYFSTVNNNKFGGGSKISHNVAGKFGVFQGNGGDIKMGLPLQSVNKQDEEMFHQPLRLSVVIQSPLDRIDEILNKNSNLRSLLDNKWIYLMVMDPLMDNKISMYDKENSWSIMDGVKINSEANLEYI